MKYLCDISKHQLLKQAYDVCIAIEACGASPQLTDAVVKASALMRGLNDHLADTGAIDAQVA